MRTQFHTLQRKDGALLMHPAQEGSLNLVLEFFRIVTIKRGRINARNTARVG